MQDFAPFQFSRTIAVISCIQLLCSCSLLLLKTTQQPFLSLWSMAYKDLWHHSWTIPGNAKQLMLKILPWCGSAAQSIITWLGLACVDSSGPGMEQQSQPNTYIFGMKYWPKSPEQNVFLFCFDDDKMKILPSVCTCSWHLASQLLLPRIQPELLIAIGKADHQKLRYKLRSLQTIPRQPVIAHTNSSSFSGQIQTFQLVVNCIFLMWLHTASAWACELDSDLTGLFKFAIIPKGILVNSTQFSIHHLLFESN